MPHLSPPTHIRGDPLNSSNFIPPDALAQIPGAWLVVDPDGNIVEGSPLGLALFPDRSALSWESLISSEVERARLQTYFESTEPGTLRLHAREGLWILFEKGSGRVGAGQPQLIRLQDLTSVFQELEDLQIRVVQLDRLVNLCRTDRQLIGYEIHDGLVQEMTAAQLFMESGLAALHDADAGAKQSLQDAATWLRRSIDDARRLIQGLEPPEFETLGLTEAVRQLTKDERLRGADVALESNDLLVDLDETLALAVFRMIQEALTNIWKHAEATEASVRLERGNESLTITVADNGKGFAPETDAAKRFGLKGMQQRAIAFGGSLEIRSEEGQGSELSMVMPLMVRNPI